MTKDEVLALLERVEAYSREAISSLKNGTRRDFYVAIAAIEGASLQLATIVEFPTDNTTSGQ